jgi:hypothetical protein
MTNTGGGEEGGPVTWEGAPGSVAPTAALRPSCASETTWRTPLRPRATRPRRNVVQDAVLHGDDIYAENLPKALGVDGRRDDYRHILDPPVFAASDAHRVQPDVWVRLRFQRSVPERFHLLVQALRELADLLLLIPSIPNCWTAASTFRVDTPHTKHSATTRISARSLRPRAASVRGRRPAAPPS